jgi:hypothetical protein
MYLPPSSEIRSYSSLQIHILESKGELTIKNPYKRKVTKEELKALAQSVGGLSFEYNREEPIEPIIQAIVSWRGREEESPPQSESPPAVKTSEEMNDTACECQLY